MQLKRCVHIFQSMIISMILFFMVACIVDFKEEQSATLKIKNDDTAIINFNIIGDVSIKGLDNNHFSLSKDATGTYLLRWVGYPDSTSIFTIESTRGTSTQIFVTDDIKMNTGDFLERKVTDFEWN